MLRKSLDIMIRAYGTEQHHEVATSYHNLGMLLNDLGRRAEAVDKLRKALDINIATLGADHPHTGIMRQSLTAISFSLLFESILTPA
jgi:hypothetical protein